MTVINCTQGIFCPTSDGRTIINEFVRSFRPPHVAFSEDLVACQTWQLSNCIAHHMFWQPSSSAAGKTRLIHRRPTIGTMDRVPSMDYLFFGIDKYISHAICSQGLGRDGPGHTRQKHIPAVSVGSHLRPHGRSLYLVPIPWLISASRSRKGR